MQIFPGYGFQQSAATPVFLGLLASWGLTETLGWAFAGIVVPGYLATLLLVEPRSALIDIAEALLTYLLARALGEYASRAGVTSRAFGRERFFLIVLVSVLVRVGVEGLLLPAAFSQPSWAYSIGLVVVPLAANSCWKTGLGRGIVQNAVPALFVYAVVRWVLVPYTSLSLAGFHLLTEDVAASFLASPKAYFVLLTGALLSSFANVRWGWDFGGILVPALLGLVVIHPSKLLTTGVEALVLLAVVQGLLLFTPVGRWNVEGPRRIVLFASVDYSLRFAAAWLLGPRLGATGFLEITGFGYLLPALIAVKASQKRDAALVLLPTALLSGGAFALGTLVGFSFDRLEAAPLPGPPVAPEVGVGAYPIEVRAAVRWSAATASATRRSADERTAVDPYALARGVFRLVADPSSTPGKDLFARSLEDGVCWFGEDLSDLDHRQGGPSVFVRCREPRRAGTVLLVSTPLGSPASAMVAGKLLAERRVEMVVVSGVERSVTSSSLDRTSAQLLASRLARLGGDGGSVVEVSDAAPGSPSDALEIPVSLREALRELDLHLEEADAHKGKSFVHIPPDAVVEKVRSPEVPWRVDATCAAAAGALEIGALRDQAESPEELLALRRLLLEPLLSQTTTTSRALALSAARDLGFQVASVLRGASHTEVAVLTPTSRSGRLAVVVRSDGGGTAVVELTHGDQDQPRRFAGALGAALDASAVLVTFASRDGGQLMGQSLALSTWAGPHKDRAVVRVEPASEGAPAVGVGLASWDVPEGAPSDGALTDALARLGLASQTMPLSPTLLDVITRREPTRLATYVLTPSVAALRSFGTLAADGWPDTAPRDGDCSAVAADLARSDLRAPRDSLEVKRLLVAAVYEHSATARRALERAERAHEVALSLVRADSGLYVAAASRTSVARSLWCIPWGGLDGSGLSAQKASSLDGCAAALGAGGGSCEALGGAP